jgi:hypothetical protein
MLFMILVKASRNSEGANLPNKALMKQMDDYNDLLDAAGVKRMAKGLHPTSNAVRFTFANPDEKPIVTQGPFPYSKDLIAGFFLIEVKSKEEALHYASLAPDPQGEGDGEIELRQLY